MASMTTIWRILSEDWAQLPADARQAYVGIVGSYGGCCDREGRGEFRRYGVAEICAHTLAHRLGIRTDIALSSKEADRRAI
jgi:hypothetical protein